MYQAIVVAMVTACLPERLANDRQNALLYSASQYEPVFTDHMVACFNTHTFRRLFKPGLTGWVPAVTVSHRSRGVLIKVWWIHAVFLAALSKSDISVLGFFSFGREKNSTPCPLNLFGYRLLDLYVPKAHHFRILAPAKSLTLLLCIVMAAKIEQWLFRQGRGWAKC